MFNKENISLIFSIISIVTSVFIAYRNIWLSRAKIKITQTDKAARSAFLRSYDGCFRSYSSDEDSNDDPGIVSVLLIEVIITNQSSLPISILEFSTKDFASNAFCSYSYTQDGFKISTSKNNTVTFGSKNSPLKFIKPEFTLNPYTSNRGYIMFWSGLENKEFNSSQDITLITTTSRKEFKNKIRLSDTYESIKKNVKYTTDDHDRPIEIFY